jgi:hypothetical protein
VAVDACGPVHLVRRQIPGNSEQPPKKGSAQKHVTGKGNRGNCGIHLAGYFELILALLNLEIFPEEITYRLFGAAMPLCR